MPVGMFFKEKGFSNQYMLYCGGDRKTYRIDLKSEKVEEVQSMFLLVELYENVHGFAPQSRWMRYCCYEDAFHTLKDFLDGTLPGEAFSSKKQLEEFANINASIHGDCGKKVYEFVNTHLGESV